MRWPWFATFCMFLEYFVTSFQSKLSHQVHQHGDSILPHLLLTTLYSWFLFPVSFHSVNLNSMVWIQGLVLVWFSLFPSLLNRSPVTEIAGYLSFSWLILLWHNKHLLAPILPICNKWWHLLCPFSYGLSFYVTEFLEFFIYLEY